MVFEQTTLSSPPLLAWEGKDHSRPLELRIWRTLSPTGPSQCFLPRRKKTSAFLILSQLPADETKLLVSTFKKWEVPPSF